MAITVVYITNPNKRTAQLVATHLLKKKLIACANIFPIDSIYLTHEGTASGKEEVLVAKTDTKKLKELEKEVAAVHPYNIPCIVSFKANANAAYEKWLVGKLKK